MIGLILFDLKIPMWKLINKLMPWSFYYLLFIFLEIDVLVLIPNIPWMGPWRDGFERILVRLWHSGFERIFFWNELMYWFYQGCQFRTVPAGTVGIYCIGQQSSMFDSPVSYRKKYRSYRPISGNTSRYRKKFFFFFF